MELSLGPGAGCRLLAPGVPEWIGADGARVGFVVRDRLFLFSPTPAGERPTRVTMVELPDLVEDVSAHPDGWVVALGQGFVVIDPAAGAIVAVAVDEAADPVTTRAGRDVGLLVEVPEQRLIRLGDGGEVSMPDGARSARYAAPWERGEGLCWIGAGTLYRQGERVAALAAAPGADGLAGGPFGAVLVSLAKSTLVAAPRQLPVTVGERLDAGSARFTADGLRVLAAGADGAVEVECATGTIVRRWPGSLLPVGWAPGPLFVDAARGALVDADGAELLDGFAGARPARAGARLVGPGGAAWDLDTGEKLDGGFLDGACGTDGARLVHVVGGEVRVRGGATVACEAGDDAVLAVTVEADVVVLTLEDDVAERVALPEAAAGPVAPRVDVEAGLSLNEEGEDSRVTRGDDAWPVPADGAAAVGADGRVWAWTHDGLLLQLA